MRTLRSRLMKNLIWNYYFYVELDGNINSEDAKDMLKALKVFCDKLKVVGTYEIK
jgi:chorismate mutase/prephenate dehydratase